MNTLQDIARCGAGAALLIAAAGCVAAADSGSKPAPAAGATQADIQALVGDAACDSNAQCRTIAIGAKACGGPAAYLAWSTLHTDEAALRAAAESYTTRQRTEAKDSGMASNCMFVADPGAYCAPAAPVASASAPGSQHICRLRSIRPAGPGVQRTD